MKIPAFPSRTRSFCFAGESSTGPGALAANTPAAITDSRSFMEVCRRGSRSLWPDPNRPNSTFGLQRLKRRLALSDSPRESKPTSSAAFMELFPVLPTAIADCLVELEDGSGRRLKIQLKGTGSQEVLNISRGLWSLSA